MSILIVGHSHIRCLMAAAETLENPDVEFCDLIVLERKVQVPGRQVGAEVSQIVQGKAPDAICLCIVGNYHNILTMVEHPKPFSVGDSVSGAEPPDKDRWFIPSAVVSSVLEKKFSKAARTIASLYEAFPESRRLYVNPPPPLSDWSQVVKKGGFLEII